MIKVSKLLARKDSGYIWTSREFDFHGVRSPVRGNVYEKNGVVEIFTDPTYNTIYLALDPDSGELFIADRLGKELSNLISPEKP